MNNQLLLEALEYGRSHIKEEHLPAQYIPKLKDADPKHLGISVFLPGHEPLSVGDSKHLFTIQSIAKTVTLILAFMVQDGRADVDDGVKRVFEDVGVEPSGDPFNSFAKLVTNRIPSNPMINAGAISTADLCLLEDGEDPYPKFLELVRKLCGRSDINYCHETFEDERSKGGFNNIGMANIMKGTKVLYRDVESVTNFYFKTCSTLVNTKDLAHYAMVLAHNGKDPNNGNELIKARYAKIVKTIMLTCGMYDDSGDFAVTTGLPAKSGVGGGIMACVENRMGIATFGPALPNLGPALPIQNNGDQGDNIVQGGNSVGGLAILKFLSERLGLHLFGGNLHYR